MGLAVPAALRRAREAGGGEARGTLEGSRAGGQGRRGRGGHELRGGPRLPRHVRLAQGRPRDAEQGSGLPGSAHGGQAVEHPGSLSVQGGRGPPGGGIPALRDRGRGLGPRPLGACPPWRRGRHPRRHARLVWRCEGHRLVLQRVQERHLRQGRAEDPEARLGPGLRAPAPAGHRVPPFEADRGAEPSGGPGDPGDQLCLLLPCLQRVPHRA
mmetsp:Transcript_7047/g.21143  ORF Transcript_7047/g.21143 Transcript_7047/m.21143 type:complete len:212 (+) Transcript_7047:302-937(+)